MINCNAILLNHRTTMMYSRHFCIPYREGDTVGYLSYAIESESGLVDEGRVNITENRCSLTHAAVDSRFTDSNRY